MTALLRPNYSLEEVEVLVEEYQELDGKRARSFFQVRLIDLDRALQVLRPKEYVAVLLCGQVGLTARTAGALVGAPTRTMHSRYRRGLERIVNYLNGGV